MGDCVLHISYFKGLDPTLGNFELCMRFGPLDRLGNCLIQFLIGNYKDSHFQFWNWSGDAKFIRF